MTADDTNAPGAPGIAPRWTSSAKSGVGTALDPASRVWFTLSHGIFNEIYYPRLDRACVRDLGLIVTDGGDFFSEEKRHCRHAIAPLAPDVPAFRLENTCDEGRYRVTKEILADPRRDVVWQRTRFIALKGDRGDYRVHVLLAPHLGNRGADNTAWVGDHKGVPMLFASRDGHALALASTAPWGVRAAGFVGVSDGWQDLRQHGRLTWTHGRAGSGNVALVGEVDLAAGGDFDLVLGFGVTPEEAGHRARAALQDGFESARDLYLAQWRQWHAGVPAQGAEAAGPDGLYRTSLTVMRTHEAKRFPGGAIASLSIPWGFAKGDDNLGGYHLVWPRDLVETAGGLLAAGAGDDARRVLDFLQATQEADGHWPQNMWLDGSAYWPGLQMDETAFPILLVDLMRRQGVLADGDLDRYWPLVRAAASFLVVNGPVSPQDRWEEDPGYSPFTLAVEVAALLAAADLADIHGEPAAAAYLRETADVWNDGIERWTFAADTDLAQEHGVRGYYVRIAPPEAADAASPAEGFVPIKNRPPGQSLEPARHIISPDALALVRFGLRAADDPRIVDTVTVIDALLKTDTPAGPVWHRYNDDGYGEHEDGAPFDGTGVGRAWPLLAGERAHYELAAGRPEAARALLKTLASFAGEGGYLPEQVWDAADLPERELFFGRPAGSAMPLVWAHAEYVKLCRSVADGAVFDLPPQTVQRYLRDKVVATHAVWRRNHKCRTMPAGLDLRLELTGPALVRWGCGDEGPAAPVPTRDTGLGIHVADLPTAACAAGTAVTFTVARPDGSEADGEAVTVVVEGGSLAAAAGGAP